MADITAWFVDLWARHARMVAGSLALAVIAGVAIYLFWHERWLRRHLADLQPDRRLAYLLHQWQLRNYQIIFALVLIATGVLSLPSFTLDTPPAERPAITPQAARPAPPEQTRSAPPQSPPAAVAGDPTAVLDLFENGTANSAELSLDALKTRHENAIVGAYILSNCNRADNEEIATLLRAIRDDIIKYQSDSGNQALDTQQLYDNTVSAAKGAYEIMYRRTECDDPQVDMLEQQFANYIMRYQAAEGR